ncbi:heme-degrading domain-containing protein [Vibrio tritonius]|uniref:heme-degrading domain-containing protein n=1 Tax=Vibrio tritonius TaxID=1435069 RepID=UPI000837D870|nr:heme-degrading domain-containing protein [Vibrio tritonius]
MMTLNEVIEQEQQLQLPRFNNDIAWQLGLKIKELAESRQQAVVIEVYAFGQTLFQYAMQGTCADHLDWMQRKRNTVLRYNKSSYQLALYNQSKQRIFEEMPHIDNQTYCAHGGAFPIRIQGSGLIGTITTSALSAEDDHALVAEALTAIKHELEHVKY